jgi:hypothetical protein
MAYKLGKLTLLFKKNRMNEIDQELRTMNEELSTTITECGSKSKVIGMVMHVSKSKKMHLAAVHKVVGEKRTKRELQYHRLVFCRYVFIYHVSTK